MFKRLRTQHPPPKLIVITHKNKTEVWLQPVDGILALPHSECWKASQIHLSVSTGKTMANGCIWSHQNQWKDTYKPSFKLNHLSKVMHVAFEVIYTSTYFISLRWNQRFHCFHFCVQAHFFLLWSLRVFWCSQHQRHRKHLLFVQRYM